MSGKIRERRTTRGPRNVKEANELWGRIIRDRREIHRSEMKAVVVICSFVTREF